MHTEKKEITPIPVQFPLMGEWCAINTPAHSIPSHGTDALGQRYAYDFLQIDWDYKNNFKFFKSSIWRYYLFGVPLTDTFCWSSPIVSPFNGKVIDIKDGVNERNPVNPFRDLFIVMRNAYRFNKKDIHDLNDIIGNHIIIQHSENIFCMIAHAKTGSIKVSKGEEVSEGQKIAEVGHSGNSTAPHLHFQLMDSADLVNAQGLPCCFKNYDTRKKEQWHEVTNGIPNRRERIRV